jgi:uncharacterized membrane protein
LEIEVPVEIAAAPKRVYAVIEDVERWPEWTASVQSVKRLDNRPSGVGGRAEVRQRKLPKATLEVTAIEPGRGFDWEASGPGIHTVGGHWVEPKPDGGSLVRLSVKSTGPATWLLGWWFRRITERYVRMEAAGLNARAEAGV